MYGPRLRSHVRPQTPVTYEQDNCRTNTPTDRQEFVPIRLWIWPRCWHYTATRTTPSLVPYYYLQTDEVYDMGMNEWMNELIDYLTTRNIGLYIGLYLWVRSDCLRTSTKMEPKGICLCKQETNVEDSFRTIVTPPSALLKQKQILPKLVLNLIIL